MSGEHASAVQFSLFAIFPTVVSVVIDDTLLCPRSADLKRQLSPTWLCVGENAEFFCICLNLSCDSPRNLKMSSGSGGAYGRVPGQAARYSAWGTGMQTTQAPYSNQMGMTASPSIPNSSSYPNSLSQSYNGRPYNSGGLPAVNSSLTNTAPAGSSAFVCNFPPESDVTSSANGTPSASTSSITEPSAEGIPDPPTRFPDLEKMSLEELRTLADERAKFDDFINRHDYTHYVKGLVGRHRAQAEKLEAEQKDAADRLKEAKDADGSDLQREIEELQNQVDKLQVSQNEWMTKFSAETLIQKLRDAIHQCEAECQRLEEQMLSGDLDFDLFLKKFLDCRKLYHERSLKLEQLKHESTHGIALGA